MRSNVIIEIAKAKINLSLRVLGRRPDGYHELESLVTFAETGDVVELEPSPGFQLETVGPYAAAIDGENLIENAVRLLSEVSPSVRLGRIRLTKHLPVAAGLGGGSADAAAVLRALARHNPSLASKVDLAALAQQLGADVTVCLTQHPALMWGIGERLVTVEGLPRFWVVLANPGVPLSTARVFRALAAGPVAVAPARLKPVMPGPYATLDALCADLRATGNDLQASALRLCPPIGAVLAALAASQACLYAAQSGSGPTCFGIFGSARAAEAAANRIASAEPLWWLRATPIG